MARLDAGSAKAGTAALKESRGLATQALWSRLLILAGIFLFWWLLSAGVYRQTTSNFLRAESGWLLLLSHSSPDMQHGFVKVVLTKNLYGHYAPFAFLAEFQTAKLAGTRASFWKWRQITVLALLATALFQFSRASGAALGLTGRQAFFSGAALTALMVFQVQMREFIAWPFMVMQLLWLLFTVLTLLSLVRMTQSPAETKWPWLAAAAAYLSLHFLGLGIATVVATGVTMGGVWLARRRAASSPSLKIAKPLGSLLGITVLHAIAMQNFLRAVPISSSPGWKPGPFLAEALGYIPNLLFAALRGLLGTMPSAPDSAEISPDWPYGVAVLLGIALLLSAAFYRAVKQPGLRNENRLLLHSFTSALFVTIIALVWMRQWPEPSPHGFTVYLSGSRHLIPASFALVGFATELFLLVARLPLLPGAILNVGLGVCAVAAHLHFATHIYPQALPKLNISHERAWHSILDMARECQQAGLAIPNVPLGELTQEFADWDLKLFEPLLRSELKLPPETKVELMPWSDITNAAADDYSRQVPSLAHVKEQLKLIEKAR